MTLILGERTDDACKNKRPKQQKRNAKKIVNPSRKQQIQESEGTARTVEWLKVLLAQLKLAVSPNNEMLELTNKFYFI